MPRALRITSPENVYHIYSRGNNKAKTFLNKRDYSRFLEIVVLNKAKYGFKLFNYSLMPNHIHLSIQPKSLNLSKIMHAIKNRYSKFFCAKYDYVGHVWQGRYGMRQIKSDADLFACGNYIEMNPVRAGLVSTPEEWSFSSYRYYAFGEDNFIVDDNPFYINLGFSPKERQLRYRNTIDKTRSF